MQLFRASLLRPIVRHRGQTSTYHSPPAARPKQSSHAVFDKIKTPYVSEVQKGVDTAGTPYDDADAHCMIIFLRKQFAITTLDKYSSAAFWHCRAKDSDDSNIHLGIISIRFNSEADREKAEKAIAKTNRNHFVLKVHNQFKVLSDKSE